MSPMAQFPSSRRVNRHYFTCHHPLAANGCLEHSSEKDAVLGDEVLRSTSDVCIGTRIEKGDMNARNLKTLRNAHDSFWVYFPIVIFRTIIKSFLNSIVLQETKRE